MHHCCTTVFRATVGSRIEILEVDMSDWWEVSQGECYLHKFTHVPVRVTKVRPHEGFTGLVTWETLNGATIDGASSEIQEAQHFLEDFDITPRRSSNCGV